MIKIILFILLLIILTGCAFGPSNKVLMKNCEYVGQSRWACEDLPVREFQEKRVI